ncbi:MAG: hypothetical protein AAGJ18_01700 [Bacteroidota bacterium]
MKSIALIVLTVLGTTPILAQYNPNFNDDLSSYIGNITPTFDYISLERKQALDKVVQHIIEQKKVNTPTKMTFLSKQNASRGQMCQIWLSIASQYYQVPNINAFSAGYSLKKFNPKVAEVLKRAGLTVEKLRGKDDATYSISASKKSSPFLVFSKTYSNSMNPKSDYVAVFVEDLAPSERAFLAEGALLSVELPYIASYDYKKKSLDKAGYDEQCRQIAQEMLYIIHATRQQLY